MKKIYKHGVVKVHNGDLICKLDELSGNGIEVLAVLPGIEGTAQILTKVLDQKRSSARVDLNQDKHIAFAKHFHHLLVKHKLIVTKVDPSLKSWIDPIRLLEEKDGLPWDQITLGANHFFSNIGDDFLPVIQSTGAFRRKFEKVYAHFLRNKKKK